MGINDCRLLITYANCLNPNPDRHSVGWDLDPSSLTLRFFKKKQQTLKATIMPAAEDKFCDIFPSLGQK